MKQFLACLLLLLAGAGCSEDVQPVPPRCILDTTQLDYGTILPPQGGPSGIKIKRQVTVTNKPELTSPAGNEHLRGTLSIRFDPPQESPPEFHLTGNNLDPDFDLALRESITYEIETEILSTTSAGGYSGTVDLGGLCAAVAFTLYVAAPPEPPPVFDFEWGGEGTDGGKFKNPSSIAVDASGILYVVDPGNLRVQKFDADGNVLRQWNRWTDPHLDDSLNPTYFQLPTGVAVDPSDLPYVGDEEPGSDKARITRFDPLGDYSFRWGPTKTGSEFESVFHLDVNSQGEVYFIDQRALKILAYELLPQGSGYNQIHTWGLYGTGPGRFRVPYGIAVDPTTGDVFVSDWFNNYIQKFTSGGSFLLSWGEPGTGQGQFKRPTGIDTDALGNLYVCDNENRRIQKFDPNGAFLTTWGLTGTGAGEFSAPVDIAVSSAGLIYVVDQGNDKILRFSPRPSP